MDDMTDLHSHLTCIHLNKHLANFRMDNGRKYTDEDKADALDALHLNGLIYEVEDRVYLTPKGRKLQQNTRKEDL